MLLRRKRIYVWSFLIALVISWIPVAGWGLSIEQITNPQSQYGGWVSDEADVLSEQVEAILNRQISRFENQTSGEIAVVTVPQVDSDLTPRAFGVRLFNHWGIGKANRNNGVLLLLSMGDRRVELITGRGIESVLTDEKAQEIVDTKMLPSLRRDRPSEALVAGTNAVIQTLSPRPFEALGLPIPAAIAGPGLFSVALLLLSLLLWVKAKRYEQTPAPPIPFEYSQWLQLNDVEKAEIKAWKKQDAKYRSKLYRLQSGSFFVGTLGFTSLVFVGVAYAVPKALALAFGCSFPIIFAYKNLPRLVRSPRDFLGQFIGGTVFSGIFFIIVFGVLGSAFVAEAESPINPMNAFLLALMATGLTTINWREMESTSSSSSSRSHGASGYGGAAGGSSGGGSSGGGGFGGGSSDGGGAGGGW